MKTAFRLAAVAVTAGLSLATAAIAQEAAAPTAPAPAATGAQTFSDAQVAHFADALQRLQKITKDYEPRIAAATGEAATTLRGEMAVKMHGAMEEAAISPEDYNAIAGVVNTDDALRTRVGQALAAAPSGASDAK